MGTVIKSMLKDEFPNSLYIIECDSDNAAADILNVTSKLNPGYILDLYKTGINCARKQLEDINTLF